MKSPDVAPIDLSSAGRPPRPAATLVVVRNAPGGMQVLLLCRAERGDHMRAHGLWHSRLRGFPRTLWGFEPYVPTLSDRMYASVRRSLRVKREAV